MYPKACFVLFALGLALVNAIPASKIDKKSVIDNPKIEEMGADKARAKKSTFCMDVQEKSGQLSQMPTVNVIPQGGPNVQTFSLSPAQQASATITVPSGQPASQAYTLGGGQSAVQTFSVSGGQQQGSKPCGGKGQGTSQAIIEGPSGVQTYNIPPNSVHTFNIPAGQQPLQAFTIPSSGSPVQTLSVIQTHSHPAPPSAVVIPQPVQPIHMQIIQPPQTAPQQPNINIVQPPVTQIKEVEVRRPEPPAPAPAPAPAPVHTYEKIIMPTMQRVEMYPVTSVCKEQMVMVPSRPVVSVPECETMVKVPQCQHVVQCDCKTNSLNVEPMQFMSLQRNRMMGTHTLVSRQANKDAPNKAEEKKE